MIRFVYFSLLLLNLLGCNRIFNCNNRKQESYVSTAQELRNRIGSELADKYHMHLIGIGGGMADKVNVLYLSYQMQGPRSKEELRGILVDCVETLLKAFNNSQELRPHLKNYPFTANEVEIAIFLVDEKGFGMREPYITVASSENNELWYRVTSKGHSPKYKSREFESYQEALDLVQKEKTK